MAGRYLFDKGSRAKYLEHLKEAAIAGGITAEEIEEDLQYVRHLHDLDGEYRSVASLIMERKLRERYKLEDDEEINLQVPKLAREIAERITSKHNQDWRVIVVGAFGKGKSTFCLYLGYRVAEEVAKIKGGKWQDYFNRENIGIADEEDILRVIQNLKKWNCYLLDDVGWAWGARNFMKKLNQFLNNVFQLMRTENTFMMISIASAFLVDKVPRNLVNMLVEMDLPLFDDGIVLAKVFKVKHRPRYGDTHTLYPVYGNTKVVRYIGRLPPAELMEQYVQERQEVERKLRGKSISSFLNEGEKQNGEGAESPDKPSTREHVVKSALYGVTDTNYLANITGVSKRRIQQIKREEGIE